MIKKLIFVIILSLEIVYCSTQNSFKLKIGNQEYIITANNINDTFEVTINNYTYDMTPLIYASYLGNLSLSKFSIENGADINAKDKNGKTALIYAVENGKLRIVEYLIENGIDINAKYDYFHADFHGKNYKGVTILMIASIIFYQLSRIKILEIFKYLIKKGADVNIEDDRCNTALDFVENYSDREVKEEIIKILIEAGAK